MSSKSQQKYLCLDIGSSALKLGLFSDQCELLKLKSAKLEVLRHGERVEFDGNQLYTQWQKLSQELLNELGEAVRDIAAFGITGQRSTLLCWDKEKLLMPAISWQDTRVASELSKYAGHEKEIIERTGLRLTAHYSGLKLKWAIDNLPAVQQAAASDQLFFGSVSSYFIWKLTAGKVYSIDHTQAQRTLLFNYKTLVWDKRLFQLFDLSIKNFPKLKATQDNYDHLTLAGHKIPIRVAIGDTQAACVAAALGVRFQATIQYGSGAFLALSTGGKAHCCPRLLTSIYHTQQAQSGKKGKRHYFIEGTVNHAATLLEAVAHLKDITQLKVQQNPAILLPSLGSLGAPHWISGLNPTLFSDQSKADLEPAAELGIGLRLREILDLLKINRFKLPNSLGVAGGLTERQGFLQTQANTLQKTLIKTAQVESALIGVAALLANQLPPSAMTEKFSRNITALKVPSASRWSRLTCHAKLHMRVWHNQQRWQEKLSELRPLWIGHRGASDRAPENTLESLGLAHQLGADGVEFDVRASLDGTVVLIHDLELNRTTHGKGRVTDYSFQELQKLDAGSWFAKKFSGARIPSLEQVLHELSPELLLLIEVKDKLDDIALFRQVIACVDQAKAAGRVAICSFNTDMVLKLKAERTDLCIGAILGSNLPPLDPDADHFPTLDLLSLHKKHFHPRLVVHRRLQPQLTFYWTIDKKSDQQKLFGADVDGIITNELPT